MIVADLPVQIVHVKTANVEYEFPQVIAATPLLTAQINQEIRESAQLASTMDEHTVIKGSTSCVMGVATSVMVSWACTDNLARAPSMSGGAMPGGRWGRTFAIEHDKLKSLDLKDVLTELDKLPCITDEDVLFVQTDGIETNGTWNGNGSRPSAAICNLGTADLKGHMQPLLEAVLAHDPVKAKPFAWTTNDRFVVSGEVVLDKLTNLDWAVHDNGADITYAAAEAYATASKLGGKTDWRLPRESEVQTLLAYVGPAHKEPGDCTKGKSALLVVAEVHPTCGILWTDTEVDDNRAISLGLISGGSRIQATKTKTNSRALLVRSHRP